MERMCRLFANQFRITFLSFPESVRMRSVDGVNICNHHYSLAVKYDVNHILSCGVGRRGVRLFYASIRIRLHVAISVRSVIRCLSEG